MRQIKNSIKNMFFLVVGFLGFSLLFFSQIISSADPLNNWHWRNPLPQGNTLNSVNYVGNLFIAVGQLGTIITSPDGISWIVRKSGTFNNLYGASFGNDIYIVVGENGIILSSPDAITWTTRYSRELTTFFDVVYGNNMFVAVGQEFNFADRLFSNENQAILVSKDGVYWQKYLQQFGGGQNLKGIIYGDGFFKAVGTCFSGIGSCINKSYDGINWELDAHFNADYQEVDWAQLTDITFGNNRFLAVGNYSGIYTSILRGNWERNPLIVDGRWLLPYLQSVTFGKDTYVAVGYNSIITSKDGANWTECLQQLQLQIYIGMLYGVAYGNGIFVAVGSYGQIITSSDGVEWIPINQFDSSSSAIAFGDGKFAISGYPKPKISLDGVHWDIADAPVDQYYLNGMTHGQNKFVAVGYSGSISVSDDALTWVKVTSPTSNSLKTITFGKDTFVAVGDNGTILSSKDGNNWIKNQSGTNSILSGVIYGNSLYIAVGEEGTILTSSDSKIWQVKNYGIPNNLLGIAYGKGKYVIVGDNGLIMTSIDTESWSIIPSAIFNKIGPIIYANNRFVALSEDGVLLVSSDGEKWEKKFIGVRNLVSLTYGKNTVVTIGSDFQILQSDPDVDTNPSISGVVIANIANYTNLSIPNASVILQGTDFSTKTDNDGNFSFLNVPTGNYTLVITANDLSPYTQNVVLSGDSIQLYIPPLKPYISGDVNGDNRLGLDDAIYIFQVLSGVR